MMSVRDFNIIDDMLCFLWLFSVVEREQYMNFQRDTKISFKGVK